MDIKFDVNNRLLFVGEKHFSLDKFEDFILKYWHPLAARHFVKAIQVEGKTKYIYDWSQLFDLAHQGGIILEEFLEREGVFKNTHLRLKQSNLFD